MMKFLNNDNNNNINNYNNVKNNNIIMNYNDINNSMNNKKINLNRKENMNNIKNAFLRSEKSMIDLNRRTKIKKIEVVQSKKNIISPDRSKKIKMKSREKEAKNNIDFINNNNKIKQTKKIIMERESFNRAKFLKDNFGIVDSYQY